MPFEIQPIHILFIIVIAVLVFGPKKLPEMGRSIGKALTEFRRASKDMTENIRQGMSEPESQAAGTTIQPPPVSIPSAAGFATVTPPSNVSIQSQAASPAPAGRFCIQCGAPNLAEAHFCSSCGAKLAEIVA